MSGHTRAQVVFTIAGFATAAIALWCALVQPLTALNASTKVADNPVAVGVPTNGSMGSIDRIVLAAASKNVTDPQPPISCKVAAKGVLVDCRINDGYDLNDVANWFQDEHSRSLEIAVNSVTLAKKFERSLESCENEKETK